VHPHAHRGLSTRPLIHAGIFGAIFLVVAAIGLFPVRSGDAALDPKLNVSQLSFPGLAASAPLVAQTEFQAAPQPLTVQAPEVSEGTVLGADDVTDAEIQGRTLAAENASVDVEDAETTQAARIAMFQNYEVQDGDTVDSIASNFGFDRTYIIWNNVDLENPDRLAVGTLLRIPYVEGIVHAVEVNETLTDIARRYDADTQDILDFEANSLADPNSLVADTLIFVPGGRYVPPVATSIRPGADAVPTQTGPWFWPARVNGTLTSLYGPSHPLGIDIAMPVSNEIVATRSGVVTFAGGDPWFSYGYYVKIAHDDAGEWTTTYAHLSVIPENIKAGAIVEQGQTIGYSGNTGNSTGPHLHFEIRWWGEPVDPLAYLP
jgi:murein DD-endopeptidase MepM/ murein hydrolase activator NlpD